TAVLVLAAYLHDPDVLAVDVPVPIGEVVSRQRRLPHALEIPQVDVTLDELVDLAKPLLNELRVGLADLALRRFDPLSALDVRPVSRLRGAHRGDLDELPSDVTDCVLVLQ